jgi:hypothetical protein
LTYLKKPCILFSDVKEVLGGKMEKKQVMKKGCKCSKCGKEFDLFSFCMGSTKESYYICLDGCKEKLTEKEESFMKRVLSAYSGEPENYFFLSEVIGNESSKKYSGLISSLTKKGFIVTWYDKENKDYQIEVR